MSDLGGLLCLLTTYRQDSPSCKAGVPDQPIGGDVAFSARWPGFVHLRVMGVGHKRSTEKMPNLFALSTKGRSSPDVLVGCRPALPGCWRLAKVGRQRFRHPVRCGGNPSLIDVRQRAAQRRDAGVGVQEEGLRTPRSPTSTSQLPAVVCRITRGSEAAPIGTVLRTRRRPLRSPEPRWCPHKAHTPALWPAIDHAKSVTSEVQRTPLRTTSPVALLRFP